MPNKRIDQRDQETLLKSITSPADDAFTLFYGKFRTNAPKVLVLMEQVEERRKVSSEYEQLLTDCYNCYFTQRLTLLRPSISSAIKELASKHARDHCALVRSGCAFMVHVCEDEHQLFRHFFSQATPLLDEMLESLCHSLYDVLRPLIIHVNHLETLAELCSILKIEMLEEHVMNNPNQLAAFESVCLQMLQDVQERLVYRTYIYIKQEILNYKPASGDLQYPEKLIMMEDIAASLQQQSPRRSLSRNTSNGSIASQSSLEVEQINALASINRIASQPFLFSTPAAVDGKEDGEDMGSISGKSDTGPVSNMPMSPADLHGMWYPTVRRTLVCLSKLYRCIDRGTFQGLSQETLMLCITSLIKAAEEIRKRKSVIDGQLFLIKHLLILREQLAPFNVDFAIKEMALDFSKLKDAAVSFVKARSKIFQFNSSNSLLQFLLEGTPQVTETFVDSRKDVDRQLKKICEDFISETTEQLTGPLKAFLTKATVVLRMNEDKASPKVELRVQPFASPEKLNEVVAQTYRMLKSKKVEIQRSMTLYLANHDTEFILFKPIKAHIQSAFIQLHNIIQQHYSEEDQQIIGAPSLEQVNLLLASSAK